MYPPELVTAAKAQMSALMAQQPAAVPTLAAGMKTRLPEYEALLGADKGRGNAEAQMLFDLGQRAFNFAANTDERGQPLRGSFVSRLAGAAKTLPGAIGKHVSAMNEIDLKLKSLALQASEKDQDQVVAQNTKLLDTKARVFGDILKENAKVEAAKLKGMPSSIFAKGDWEWNVVNMPGLTERYAAGATNPEEDKLIASAITKFKTPRFEMFTDPVTKVQTTRETPGVVPSFVQAAEAARIRLGKPGAATPALTPPGVRVQGGSTTSAGGSEASAAPAPGAAAASTARPAKAGGPPPDPAAAVRDSQSTSRAAGSGHSRSPPHQRPRAPATAARAPPAARHLATAAEEKPHRRAIPHGDAAAAASETRSRILPPCASAACGIDGWGDTRPAKKAPASLAMTRGRRTTQRF
jgi:hypothetical protein